MKLEVLESIDVALTNDGQSLSANQNNASYQWLNCNEGNTAIVGATSQVYTPTTNGQYAVQITAGSCIEVSNCETILTVGTGESDNYGVVKIYPNPSNGEMTIEVTEMLLNTKVKILNVLGKQVASYDLTQTSTYLQLDLENGIYFVLIDGISSKIILEK